MISSKTAYLIYPMQVIGDLWYFLPLCSDTQVPPKCKTTASRESAFKLLAEMGKDCTETFQEITKLLFAQLDDIKLR